MSTLITLHFNGYNVIPAKLVLDYDLGAGIQKITIKTWTPVFTGVTA